MAVSVRSAKLPIVAQLLDYRRDWFKSDLAAGLSVAAVSLPSAIAYPAIAGLPTEVGFFATILALVAYAMFGPSRQLIVGPDAATCIMLASVLTSLGAVDIGRLSGRHFDQPDHRPDHTPHHRQD
jgi:sulfate permease, SulP family